MTVMKPTVLASLTLMVGLCVAPADAQEDRDAILATVQTFLDALSENDAVLGGSALLPDGQYYRLRNIGDTVDLERSSHRELLRDFAAGESDFLERIWEPTVLQHGRIAVVWTSYDFHRYGEFSHCGVDVFNLIETGAGWRIAGIMYTVEPEGCEPSPLGPPARVHGSLLERPS